MEKYKELFKGICRVCLSYGNGNNFVSLTDMKCKDGLSCYGKAIRTFAHISIKNNDNFPTMMCQNCLILLKNAIRFKLKCELSQKRLELLTKQFVNKNITDENIGGIIVQYVLFSHYFPNECVKKAPGNNLSPKKLKEPQINFGENRSCIEAKHDLNDFDIHGDDCINDFEITLPNENGSDEDFSRIENVIQLSSLNNKKKESRSDSVNYFNDDIFHENGKKVEVKPSDDDSGDELLNQMDKIITKYPYLSVNDYDKQQMKRKQIKNRKIQDKRLFIARSRLLARKLQYKINIKKNKEKFVCKVCHRVLANQHTYDHHMQRHNGFRFMCEHCGKGFPILAELQRHQVVRHGTGPFLQCQHCSYKAPRKLNLIEHERLHTGERPYTCDKCGLTFRRRAIWRKHMIYHADKTIQCPHCPRKFFRVSEMQAHANSIHERLYVYLCHKCDATYAKTETVRRHLTERHGIPREMQGKILRINKGRGTAFPDHEQ